MSERMVPVHISYSDGHFSMTEVNAEIGTEQWPVTATIPLRLWQAYQDFGAQLHMWHHIIGRLDNESYEQERT